MATVRTTHFVSIDTDGSDPFIVLETGPAETALILSLYLSNHTGSTVSGHRVSTSGGLFSPPVWYMDDLLDLHSQAAPRFAIGPDDQVVINACPGGVAVFCSGLLIS